MIYCCFSWLKVANFSQIDILLFVCIQKDFVIQEALEEHDKDGDGFVSLEEFLGDYRRDPSKEKGWGHERRIWTEGFGMGWIVCTFILSFLHLHLQILNNIILSFGIIQFHGTGHSRSLFQTALYVFGSSLYIAHPTVSLQVTSCFPEDWSIFLIARYAAEIRCSFANWTHLRNQPAWM